MELRRYKSYDRLFALEKARNAKHGVATRIKCSLINSKLSEQQIIDIMNSKLQGKALAAKYKVGTATISRIRNKEGLRVNIISRGNTDEQKKVSGNFGGSK